MHWPHLAPEVVTEALLLRTILKRGFEPPKVAGARIESLQAGIIHSPAVGFFMDISAAIRAVYVGDQPTIGRKVTLWLDRHGDLIQLPRSVATSRPDQAARAARR